MFYQNQQYPQYQQYQQQYQPYKYQPQPSTNIEYVNGIEGAKAMALMPNSIRLYLDSEAPVFYIKRTDLEGRPTIQVYQYTDTKEQKVEFVSFEQFNLLKNEIEEIKKVVGAKNE